MDSIKEFLEAMSTRVKSPVIGSVIISFVLWNWKVLFYLAFAKSTSIEKFGYFDAHMSIYSILIIPVLFGVVFSMISPWIRLYAAKFVKLPVEKYHELQTETAHKNKINKLENKIAREELEGRLIIERKKIDYEASLIDGAAHSEEAQLQLEKSREVNSNADISLKKKSLTEGQKGQIAALKKRILALEMGIRQGFLSKQDETLAHEEVNDLWKDIVEIETHNEK